MMWIAAYLYLSGAFASFLYADERADGRITAKGFLLGIVLWPVTLPAVTCWAVFDALRDEYRAWRARRAGAV